MGYFGNKKKKNNVDSTDEESGVHEIADILRNVDIRTVSSNQGFETSFLMIEGRALNIEEYDDESFRIHEDESWKGTWLCRPYKRERLSEEIYAANRKGIAGHAAVLNTLKDTGITIFMIDSKVSTTTADVLDSIRNVLHHVCKEERSRPSFNPSSAQRCLLYRDVEGRFFNLTLGDHSASLAAAWEEKLKTFSSVQALSFLMILCRSFACITQKDTVVDSFQPAYFAAMLGLVFSEETSLSWSNVSMFVRGFPSVSACSITTRTESDWLRKLAIFVLLLAAVTDGYSQHSLVMLGVGMTCCILLANLGSRAWGFLSWQPIGSWGIFEPIVAYIAAICAGLCVPFLGHRQVESGGKASIESVIGIALIVAILFIISDYDAIQKYLVIGSENCSQDYVNLGVGAWWMLASFASMLVVYKRERVGIWPEEEEPLLEKDHASPIGFKVPNLPDFPIDPTLAQRGFGCFSLRAEFMMGSFMALTLGGFMCFLSFTDFYDQLEVEIYNFVFN